MYLHNALFQYNKVTLFKPHFEGIKTFSDAPFTKYFRINACSISALSATQTWTVNDDIYCIEFQGDLKSKSFLTEPELDKLP